MSRPVTCSWWMKVPCSSAAPARSASPSRNRPRSKPPPAIMPNASSMCGRIGSGLTPPKYGLRSWWSSVTRIRPPSSSRLSQPAPEPHSGSTSTEMSAAFSASRSTVRRTNCSYPSYGSKRSTNPAASASASGRRSIGSPPLRAICASITARISWPAAAPVGALTLNPLSVHGLWLAVITMPAAAPRDTTS